MNFNFLLASLQGFSFHLSLLIEGTVTNWAPHWDYLIYLSSRDHRGNVLASPMNYLLFYPCWVKSALIWYLKKLPYKNPKERHHDTTFNNTGLEEKKISTRWDGRISFMASSKYRELLPLWNVQGVLSKCPQNVGRKMSVQRPGHKHTSATSPLHRHGKSCPTRNSAHICLLSEPPPQEWALGHQSHDRGLLPSRPLNEGGRSRGAPASPWEGSGYGLRLRHNVVSLDGDGHLRYCAK